LSTKPGVKFAAESRGMNSLRKNNRPDSFDVRYDRAHYHFRWGIKKGARRFRRRNNMEIIKGWLNE